MTSCAWSILFTLAQHASFSPSFSSPSLKQLLPIHLFSRGSFSWAACLNSLYIIRNAWKINVYCMKTCINFTKCIFPSFVAFFCIYLETSEWCHKGFLCGMSMLTFCLYLYQYSIYIYIYLYQYRTLNKGIWDVCNTYLHALSFTSFILQYLYQSQHHFM